MIKDILISAAAASFGASIVYTAYYFHKVSKRLEEVCFDLKDNITCIYGISSTTNCSREEAKHYYEELKRDNKKLKQEVKNLKQIVTNNKGKKQIGKAAGKLNTVYANATIGDLETCVKEGVIIAAKK